MPTFNFCIFITFSLLFFLVLQLLQKGANPNLVDREGRTALIAAAHTGSVSDSLKNQLGKQNTCTIIIVVIRI